MGKVRRAERALASARARRSRTIGRSARSFAVVVLLCSLATAQARAGGLGGGIGRLIGVRATSGSVGEVQLIGVIVVKNIPHLINAHTGSFSGTWEPCDTPGCLQSGYLGGIAFDATQVPLTAGTTVHTGALSGYCQGGGLDLVADGEELGTTCYATVAGQPTGPFKVIVDAPVGGAGTFCSNISPVIGAACTPSDELSSLVGSLFPF